MSLKLALEKLLGGPCYHMAEVVAHPEHVPAWLGAARGEMPDWRALFRGYHAVVDWPAASFWREIAAAFPEAPVLLSTRDPQSWWKSARATIFPVAKRAPEGPWRDMIESLFASRFTWPLDDERACISAFERHNAEVRRAVPESRLVDWTPSDGWGPLCAALGVAVPDAPFPRVNTTEDFLGAHLLPGR